LKDAPILLLDEPTASLDTESEQLIQTALAAFGAGRATLVVAHRLSTIRNADLIVVLAGGRVVEQGTHEDLMRAHGRYHALVAGQSEVQV
jgi:ABC-type multidrug transport system fused ATPase/permease subunit